MAFATNGTCELYYDVFGDADDPTLLLINGLGSQCINYHEDWCQKFVDRGLRVIRFDNRDIGLSTKFDDALRNESGAAYRLSDMSDDAFAVLTACGVGGAHIMGLSMGGAIAQMMAIEHPERLLSMTSVMSATGEPEYGRGTPAAMEALIPPPPVDRESFVAQWIAGLRIWGSPEFSDEERWRSLAEHSFDRNFHPGATERQYAALVASLPWADRLQDVTIPTLVMHGSKDTLVDPSGGRRTADLIPGARFVLIEGMGHDYPPQLWDRWVDLVAIHALGS